MTPRPSHRRHSFALPMDPIWHKDLTDSQGLVALYVYFESGKLLTVRDYMAQTDTPRSTIYQRLYSLIDMDVPIVHKGLDKSGEWLMPQGEFQFPDSPEFYNRLSTPQQTVYLYSLLSSGKTLNVLEFNRKMDIPRHYTHYRLSSLNGMGILVVPVGDYRSGDWILSRNAPKEDPLKEFRYHAPRSRKSDASPQG